MNGRTPTGNTWTSQYDVDGNPTSFEGNWSVPTFNADDQDPTTGMYGNAYDGNGNPTTYKGATATFDAENRLESYGGLTGALSNADGLRIKKQTSTGTSYYLYDGGEPVEEVNGSGTVTALNTFGADGLVSRWTTGGASSTFYQYDPMGNVSHRSDGTATTLSSDLYDAWGNAIAGSSTDPFGYGAQVGYYTDHESGLMLLGHRYYDPTRGRFLNRDPIGYDGGDNLYGYVGDDPVDWADPSGLFLYFWEKPVRVVGGSNNDRELVYALLDRIWKTKRGKVILDTIIGPWYQHGTPVTIVLNNQKQLGSRTLGRFPHTIDIDPHFHPKVPTTNHVQEYAPTVVVIAHELGHSVFGTPDDWPNQMHNVWLNENPVRVELGIPRRTSY